MNMRTESENLFEKFCELNSIHCEKIPESMNATPDYHVLLAGRVTVFEIKQIDKDGNFSAMGSTRKVGEHIRRKIDDARDQLRNASSSDSPTVLLIYNNLDPLQLFGTSEVDFRAAMYGDPTVVVSVESVRILDSYDGENRSFRTYKNVSFSALGHMRHDGRGNISVLLYENIYAKVPLAYEQLPKCFTYRPTVISEE